MDRIKFSEICKMYTKIHNHFTGFLLGRVQFWVHVGFIPAFSCRSLINICFIYNLQCHLHFALQTQDKQVQWAKFLPKVYCKMSNTCKCIHLSLGVSGSLFILTPRTFFPSFSMEQGHQPLTDCCLNRDLAFSVLCAPISRASKSIIAREHFSGVFAGATRSRKSSSSVPRITQYYAAVVRFCNVSK